MSFRTLQRRSLAWLPGALALTLSAGHALAATQDSSAGSNEHAGHDHHHHHHEMPTGTHRSLASYTVPDVTLIDQQGQPVALPTLLDSDGPVMLNFIFTTCTAICPAMSAIFARVQTELGSDSENLRMVSISIDPEQDTPEALDAYAKRFDAGRQWRFLTGSFDDSIAVQQAFNADRGDKMNHAPLTLFRATPDAEWVRYEGFATAAQLVEEYRSILAESAGDGHAHH